MNRWFHRYRGGAVLSMVLASSWLASFLLADGKLEPIQVGKPQRLELFPAQIKLSSSRDQARVIVTGHYADGTLQDLTRTAEMKSTNEAIAALVDRVVRSRGDGSAEILVVAGGREARLPVEVTGAAGQRPRSFESDALVALSKSGCNQGACHGSPSGKGGFRLSLRAFDPKLDELTLIHEDYGRRTNALQPDESLLLLKPLMKVPHGGGLKLRENDPAFVALRDWIAEGCHVDPPHTPRCVKLEVYPPSGRVLKRPAHTQQLSVRAHFSDGSIRDVTEMAVYSCSDEEVASVSEQGFVVSRERGEAAILVRYLEHIQSCFITFVRDVEGFTWKNPPQNNYVDDLVHQKLQQLKFLPSATCSDEEFIRRASLDVIGVSPTIAEVSTFLADASGDKRAHLVDQLLERPEFAKFWALKWGDLLRLTTKQVGNDGVYKYHRWLERAFATNMSYDEFARELLTAAGSTMRHAPANFYRTATDANDCVETVSQIFLGARLQCAKCHNHPFERWTQDNYYGMAAFFNRVQRKKTTRPDELLVYVTHSGEVTQPRTGQQMKPWLPNQGDVAVPEVEDRRQLFVDWLVKPGNAFFGKVEVNRLWGQLLGGIVEPIDDFRESNPPSNAALLEALAKDFEEHGYDRKHIIRTILNSRTYQSSFETNEFNKDDEKYFSHYQPRLLGAEQLLDAICAVTGVAEQFGPLPSGTKATQLPAPDIVKHEFLKIFGQPERQTVCACERSNESNLGMAIQFFNGPLIYNKLRDENNRFRQLAKAGKTDSEIIEQLLYLAAVNRQPSSNELDASLKHIASKDIQIAAQNAEIDKQVSRMNQQVADMMAAMESKLRDDKLARLPEAIRADVKAALAASEKERSEVQKYLVEKLGPLVAVTADEAAQVLDGAAKKQKEEWQGKAAELAQRKLSPGGRRLEALEDVCWALLNTNEFLFQH